MPHNKKYLLSVLICLLITLFVHAQSFKKLSGPEKRWVIFHPLKAKKAARVTREVLRDLDSIKLSGVIGNDNNGGALDAFKHSYWMAMLSLKIGAKQTKKIGIAHEKGNYKQFKKEQNEDTTLPDSVSSAMDLFNNNAGIHIFGNCKTIDKTTLQKKLLNALKSGKLKMIRKNADGSFLDCNGNIIDLSLWRGKWANPKCLIDSY